MSLEEEIKVQRQEIHTDSYPMSIGELINLYKDNELDIHPEFQRVYRWTETQKSELIESILLGIPLPSFFMSQRDDGVWDVVDGMQRLSTIFSFVGIYKDENDIIQEPLELKGTEYLPSLEGKIWTDDEVYNAIPGDIQRSFKREKIDIKIIKKESAGAAKYELFQRLNTGGSRLSDQEVRNCLLLMLNTDAYEWFKDLADFTEYDFCTPISEKQTDESYKMELVLRFFVFRISSDEIEINDKDMGPFLTNYLKYIADPETVFNFESEKVIFKKTFSLLNETLGDRSFRKYNLEKDRHEGALSTLLFEVVAIGLSININDYENIEDDISEIRKKIKSVVTDPEYITAVERGYRGTDRFKVLRELGKRIFTK